MSIDAEVFAQLIGELEAYYKREFTPFIKRIWFKYLSERLTTEEFMAAVEQVIASKQFMPSPQDLVESVKGDRELLAATEWSLCHKEACRGNRETVVGLSAKGQTALYLIGGLKKIAASTAEETTWQRKEFIRLWLSVPESTNSLPGLPQAKPIEVEVAPMPESVKQQMDELMKKVVDNGRKARAF